MSFAGFSGVHAGKSPAFGRVEKLAKKLGVELDLYLYASDSHARLALIRVPAELRGQGLAQKVMQAITEAADSECITVTLSASDSFGSSVKRLVDFYKGYGFVENKGRRRRFEFRDTMFRDPRCAR